VELTEQIAEEAEAAEWLEDEAGDLERKAKLLEVQGQQEAYFRLDLQRLRREKNFFSRSDPSIAVSGPGRASREAAA
jgi:hypothetical protein